MGYHNWLAGLALLCNIQIVVPGYGHCEHTVTRELDIFIRETGQHHSKPLNQLAHIDTY